MNDYTSGQGATLQQVLKNGFSFAIAKHYTGFLSKKKKRTFVIKPLVLGTICRIVENCELLDYDEDRISDDPMREVRQLTKKHAYACCKIIAIATWPNATCLPGVLPLLGTYVFYHIESAKLWKLQNMVQTLCNYPDFINSIRYLSAYRTTKPSNHEPSKQSELQENEN